jgi:4-amino-4-deoxy-L-arabinose transferase-like glycosyltransferase
MLPTSTGIKKMSLKFPLPTRWTANLAVLTLLGIAFMLRIYRLQDYPIQVNVDELSNMYDAWSIAETGADRWGSKNPVALRAFGDRDYKPALYVWLGAATVKMLGYSIFAGRFTSVWLAMLALLLLYLTAKKIGGRLFAFLSLLLATFSPWHLSLSRIGLESAIFPAFLVLLSLYLWVRAKEKNYPLPVLILLGLVVGLATSASQASKLTFFLVALTLLADLFIYSGQSYKKVLVLGCCCLIGAVPQLWAVLTMPERFTARANDTLMPFSYTFYYGSNLLRNFFSNLSPGFLFFSFSVFNNETIGRMLPVEFAFFYLGLFHLGKAFIRPLVLPAFYFYLLLVIVIIPSALTLGNPHALRVSGLVALLPMLTAAGILYVLNQIRDGRWKKVFLVITTSLVVANSLYFIGEYTGSEEFQNDQQENYLALMSAQLNQYKDRYSRVYLEDMGNMPYIYITHFCQIPPRAFHRAQKVIENRGLDHFIQLDKYYFLSPTEIDHQVKTYPGKSLIVLKQRHRAYKLIDSIEAYNRKKIFFHESNKQVLKGGSSFSPP